MKRTLITGALGFVGGELTRTLINDGRYVTVLVRDGKQQEARIKFGDIIDVITLEELVDAPQKATFETIFHLATVYVYENTIQDIPRIIEANITLPTTLADIVARNGTQVSFVNISTFMQHFEGSEYSPTCLYAATKKSIEDILVFYTNTFENFQAVDVVFPHIYGENDTRLKLVNLLVNASKSQSVLHLASGRQVLDLVHVKDAVTALKIAENLGKGRWSIGSSRIYSVREITELIQEISGVQLEINFDIRKDRNFDTFEVWETARRLPGWTQQIELPQWLIEQFAKSRSTD